MMYICTYYLCNEKQEFLSKIGHAGMYLKKDKYLPSTYTFSRLQQRFSVDVLVSILLVLLLHYLQREKGGESNS